MRRPLPEPPVPLILALALILLFLILAGGCSSLPRHERAWHALHVIDAAQTLQVARHPDCYREVDPVTSRLIGEHPSQGEVAAWAVGRAVLYHAVNRKLEEHDAPRWIKWTWNAVHLGATGHAVVNNFNEGLTPFGAEDC